MAHRSQVFVSQSASQYLQLVPRRSVFVGDAVLNAGMLVAKSIKNLVCKLPSIIHPSMWPRRCGHGPTFLPDLLQECSKLDLIHLNTAFWDTDTYVWGVSEHANLHNPATCYFVADVTCQLHNITCTMTAQSLGLAVGTTLRASRQWMESANERLCKLPSTCTSSWAFKKSWQKSWRKRRSCSCSLGFPANKPVSLSLPYGLMRTCRRKPWDGNINTM